MSQMDGVTKEIDGDTYKILMLDPMTAGDLLVDLIDIFGPSLSIVGSGILKAENSKEALRQLMDGVEAGDEQGEQNLDAVGDLVGDNLERAIMGVITRLTKDKQRHIFSTLRSVTSVQKGNDWPSLESVWEVHFRGRVKAMYKWVVAAIRVQYEGFF